MNHKSHVQKLLQIQNALADRNTETQFLTKRNSPKA